MAMLGIDSKLYEILNLMMKIIFISIIAFVLAIPLFTIPIAILVYCQVTGNIIRDKGMFQFCKFTKKRCAQIALMCIVGICSLYSTLIVAQMQDFFISRLIISLIISFNVISSILILEVENKFISNLRNAFFYSIAYFHKSVLLIFLFIQVMRIMNGNMQVYLVILITSVFCYLVFKLNYKTIVMLKGEKLDQ